MKQQIYIAGCCRTAVGSFGGSLKDISAAQLGAIVIKEALDRAGIEPAAVDEVVFGSVLTAGQGQNIARQASIKAGLPIETPAVTINMVCGSGMKAVVDGARAILAGEADVVVVGGTENMSASPYVLPAARWGARMGHTNAVDTLVNDGLWDAFNNYHMGVTAENICEQWDITREELDDFAYQSQSKAAAALAAGKFTEEIVPVPIKVKRETAEFVTDEYIRPNTTREGLAKLKPAFKEHGRVTAGNASGINDGAAAVVLVSKKAVEKYQLKPLFQLTGWGQAGVDPSIMGIGPVSASKKAIEKAQLTIDKIDLVEANEAFASQSIAVARDLGLSAEKVNVNGGAIAIGHPIGASGARIIVTLLHEMKRRPDATKGLATLCIGGGMGIATVFEKCESEELE